MNPTAKPLTVTLDGKRYIMHIDLNTFERFEEVTGKHFFEFIGSLQEAAAPIIERQAKKKPDKDQAKELAAVTKEMMEFLRHVSARDLRAFVHAAIHTYDANDEPHWTLTVGQVGRLITPENFATIVTTIMRGSANNNPQKEEIREVKGEDRPTEAGETPASGGPGFGPSDETVLASLTTKSED